jgi:Mor family transcriptional regulator
MKRYKKAESVLPKELLDEIQQYIQGEYLYIPSSGGERRAWGEKSGARKELAERNRAIRADFKAGTDIEVLAETYFLSVNTIKKIVYGKSE